MSATTGPYYLINSHVAHDGPIRSISIGCNPNEILTGSQSDVPVVRRWKISEDKLSLEEVGEPLYHDHWITALTSLQSDSKRSFYPDGCIITGCMDSIVRVFSSAGELLAKLQGHQKGIIDFSWSKEGFLLSGSWDGTVIVWDLSTSQIIHRLGPHENGVHVLGLTNGQVATVSTGESVNGQPAHFRLRFWDLSTGQLVGTPIEDHSGSIRSIRALPGIEGMVTTANDGTVMLRSQEGQVLEMVQHPLQDDGAPPFILDCAALCSEGGMDVVSCGEDGSVMVWQASEVVQQIPHPTTIWTVLALPGDTQGAAFFTAGHDGMLRLFSRDPVLTSQPVAQQLTESLQLEVSTAKAQKQRGPSSEDLAKAPKWEDRLQHPGKSEHQVMVFNESGSRLIAAQWISGAWVVIGEVTGSGGDGGDIDGVYYDHVFPVEMETSTGLRQLKLGFNNAENPFIASQRFIDQHGLPQYHLQEIADWIIARAKTAGQTPTLGTTTNNNNNITTTAVAASIPTTTGIAPDRSRFSAGFINGYAIFDDVPPSNKLITKLQEINTSYQPPTLNENTFHRVEILVQTLTQVSGYHATHISTGDIQLLVTLLQQWTIDHLFIVFDLLRLIVLHPDGSEELSKHVCFPMILDRISQLLSNTTTPYQCILTCTRFLANALKSELIKRSNTIASITGKDVMISITKSVCIHTLHTNKLVRLSSLSYLSNLLAVHVLSQQQVVFHGSSTLIVQQMYREIVKCCEQTLIQETESVPTLARALQVLGTLLVLDNASYHTCREVLQHHGGKSTIQASLERWRGKAPGDAVITMYNQLIPLL